MKIVKAIKDMKTADPAGRSRSDGRRWRPGRLVGHDEHKSANPITRRSCVRRVEPAEPGAAGWSDRGRPAGSAAFAAAVVFLHALHSLHALHAPPTPPAPC